MVAHFAKLKAAEAKLTPLGSGCHSTERPPLAAQLLHMQESFRSILKLQHTAGFILIQCNTAHTASLCK
jgi:hypothetical protein